MLSHGGVSLGPVLSLLPFAVCGVEGRNGKTATPAFPAAHALRHDSRAQNERRGVSNFVILLKTLFYSEHCPRNYNLNSLIQVIALDV